MTLLVISPDYASHLLPLTTIATAWREAGERVVVATGPATAGIVAAHGYEHVTLRLGRGSNSGVIRPEDQPPGEDEALRGFFRATAAGPVPTLLFQTWARRTDLLWEPLVTARAVARVVDDLRPDTVVVDHLAFGATLGLRAAGVPYGDVVLGHPTALPVGAEIYGLPTAWPDAFAVPDADLALLTGACLEVRDSFTADWNAASAELAPDLPAVDDAFAVHGGRVLYNYPSRLHDPARTAHLPPHEFLGGLPREEDVPPDVGRWLAAGDGRPVVYVSFGSFLSARADVLARVCDALRQLEVRVVLATGSADPDVLGRLPAHWLVRRFLPQVAVLRQADLVVTHGGNNSVTEALAYGVPMVVLPFSTDQFVGAAALEATGAAVALAPNDATPAELASAVRQVLTGGHGAVAASLAPNRHDLPAALRARRFLLRV